ncbi:M14 family zinc carboxypeptidase [Pseudokineococcus lusitanus]|uniref:Zinc carboxypeptidase n=1 Tax=Pseudokineococcus lusitanus TaxID=763993 RepID=A0A3N1HTF0_9ACTN|nr:M14 family zinc carboxypeptidase [Pseudokineococcus lusitanus]ROP45795.1 zinc carboxypeptidase [Pseudokineococcus lusitanus]
MPLSRPRRAAARAGLGGLAAAVVLAASPGAVAAPSAAPTARAADAATPAAVASALGDAVTTQRATAAAAEAPASYPVQPQLRVYPADPADASIARGALPYAEIAPRLQALMASSDLVSTEVVGTSTKGREILLVTLTTPETAEQTAQQAAWRDLVKADPEAAAADADLAAGYKTPVWFNNNIHGNEWEGTDASLLWIEELVGRAESGDAAALEQLSTSRLYFTVTNNPDGRVAGARRTAVDLDPNRDFITNETPETVAIRDLAGRLQPVFFSDIHGYTSVLQVEPCGPPHGENYDYDLFLPHAYASALRIEEDVAAADIEGNTYLTDAGAVTTENTGKIRIPYRDIRAGWDDWPPIFTAQYLAFQGSVTSTVELPLGRVATDTPEGLAESARRTKVNTEVAEQVITSTTDYALENADELLANQVEVFRRGSAGEPLRTLGADPDPTTVPGPDQWADVWDETDVYRAEFPAAYVIPAGGDQSSSSAARLVDHLVDHGVEVGRIAQPREIDGTTYARGSYVVDMRQPLRGLANALLAEGSDISDRVPEMYDVSAWSLSDLWGADVEVVQSLPRGLRPRPVEAATSPAAAPARTALRLELTGTAEVRALTTLLDDGVPVALLPDGSAVVPRGQRAAALAVARAEGVAFTATPDVTVGRDGVVAATALTVAYTTASTTDDVGEDYLSLVELGVDDPVRVTAASLADGSTDLDDVDLLWVGAGLTSRGAPLTGAALAELQAYADRGGSMIGRGTAATAIATQLGYLDVTAVQGNSAGNGVVDVVTPEGSRLGAATDDRAFVYGAVHFTDLGDGAVVEQTYGAEPLVAGHWRALEDGTGGPDAAAGQPSVVSGENAAGGTAVLFGTYPTFRVHPLGMLDDVARTAVDVALR